MDVRLEIALRYIVGGSGWDIQINVLISVPKFYRTVWFFVEAVNEEFEMNLDVTDVITLRKLE